MSFQHCVPDFAIHTCCWIRGANQESIADSKHTCRRSTAILGASDSRCVEQLSFKAENGVISSHLYPLFLAKRGRLCCSWPNLLACKSLNHRVPQKAKRDVRDILYSSASWACAYDKFRTWRGLRRVIEKHRRMREWYPKLVLLAEQAGRDADSGRLMDGWVDVLSVPSLPSWLACSLTRRC